MTWGGVGEWVWPGSGDSGGRVRLTVRVAPGPTSLVGCSPGGAPLLTRVSLHNVQVFRLLLKTSVERNANELKLLFGGLCRLAEPRVFVKRKTEKKLERRPRRG